jgi:hypothetical protein
MESCERQQSAKKPTGDVRQSPKFRICFGSNLVHRGLRKIHFLDYTSVEGANGHCGPADVHLPASALPAQAALAFAHEGGHRFRIF